MTAYGERDPWQSFVDEGWAKASAATGFASEAECPVVLTARGVGDVSVGEAFDILCSAGQSSLDLLRWIALFMLDRVPAAKRNPALTALGTLDPPSAALVYCWQKHLTADEREVLKAIFMPVMPVMRDKIESGALSRAGVSD